MEREHKMTMMMSSKFSCEICNKRFPCGKSLGGHLRSHRIGASMVEEDCCRSREFSNYNKELCPEVGGSSGYGLRTNPKKTRRFRDSSSVAFRHQSYGNVCKECGKVFQSMKALCGHMASHSEKEKASDYLEEEEDEDDDHDDDDEDDDDDDDDDYVEDIEEEDGEEDVIDQLAKKDKNFKPLMESDDESSGYSSLLEIGDEQEELAKCLMMLSRDNRRNSEGPLGLDSKSSPIGVRVRAMEGLNSVSKFDEIIGMKKSQNRDSKLKNVKSEYGHLMYDEDSGSSTNKQVKIKEFVKPGRVRNIAGAAAHSGKKLEKKIVYPAARKRVQHNSESPEFVSPYAKRNSFSSFTDIKQKHQCDVCYKLFDSRKALSGHKSASSCYRKVPTFCPEPSRELNSRPRDSRKPYNDSKKKHVSTKRSYRHECPICFRLFKSGQALGGHKRSHFLGSSEDRTVTIESQDMNKVQGLIDLNLPAPLEEDVSEQLRFVLC